MKRTTSVVELKSRLSEHLRLVKAGHELIVTERGVPVARMVPLDQDDKRSTRRIRLTRAGALRPGRGRLPVLLKRAPAGGNEGAGVLAALLDERGDVTSDR